MGVDVPVPLLAWPGRCPTAVGPENRTSRAAPAECWTWGGLRHAGTAWTLSRHLQRDLGQMRDA
eukprot:3249814-Alexandrium_andersonii.AAC.1